MFVKFETEEPKRLFAQRSKEIFCSGMRYEIEKLNTLGSSGKPFLVLQSVCSNVYFSTIENAYNAQQSR